MARTSIQVLCVLGALLAWQHVSVSATPFGGLGGFLGSNNRDSTTESSSSPSSILNPLHIPQKVFNAFVGAAKPSDHQHQHETAPKKDEKTTSAPSTARPPKVSEAPAAQSTTSSKPVETVDRNSVPSSTAAPSSTASPSSTAAPSSTASPSSTAAPRAPATSSAPAAASSTAKPTKAHVESAASSSFSDVNTSERPFTSVDVGNFTTDQLSVCREKWVEVTNTTISENLDILAVLLDYGGFPGLLENDVIKWERNDSDTDFWQYFYGDTDYKTYIRSERGYIHSKQRPVMGATPESVKGDIWWAPQDFCGKLRHSAYEQAPELRASNQAEVCLFAKDQKTGEDRVICWKNPDCVEPQADPSIICPRGGVSGALMASLVG